MDQLTHLIQDGYQNKQLSMDNLESLETLIQKLLKPAIEKKKEQQVEKAKLKAWKFFWEYTFRDEFEPKNYIVLMSYLKEICQEWDIRAKNGYIIRGSFCTCVVTNPYFYSKDIYYEYLESGNGWSDGLKFDEEDYKQLIERLANLKTNQMWRYIDCPNCNDKCKCQKLNDLDSKGFQELLDQPSQIIERRNYVSDPLDRDYLDRETSLELDQMKNNLENILRRDAGGCEDSMETVGYREHFDDY